MLGIAEPSITDSSGNGCDIEVEESYLSIDKKVDTSVYLLEASDDKRSEQRELIVTDIFNNLVKLN